MLLPLKNQIPQYSWFLTQSCSQLRATTSRALRLFPSPRAAAYRQMHKEFNKVDLMRERRGGGCIYISALLSTSANRSDQVY